MGRRRRYEDTRPLCVVVDTCWEFYHPPRDLWIKISPSFTHARLNADSFRYESYSSGDLHCSQQRLGFTVFISTEVLRRTMSRFQSSFLRLQITALALSSLAHHDGGFLWPAATRVVSWAGPDTQFLCLSQLNNSPNISVPTLLPWALGKYFVHLQRFLPPQKERWRALE